MPKKKSDSLKSNKIEKIFDKQNKEYSFRQPEILDYRKQSKETLNKSINKRLEKLEEKEFKSYEITKERIEKRYKVYNLKYLEVQLIEVEKGVNKGKLEYILVNPQNRKIEGRLLKKNAWTKAEHEKHLRDEYAKRGFNFEKYYIKEDSEPLKEEDSDKNKIVSYNTYFRASIIIYRLKKGKKYEVIFQAPNNDNYSNWIYSRSIFVSYQRSIAIVKEDILRNTGITLEEWIYLSKTKSNIYIEGGISYNRKKGIHREGKQFEYKPDYDFNINFRDL